MTFFVDWLFIDKSTVTYPWISLLISCFMMLLYYKSGSDSTSTINNKPIDDKHNFEFETNIYDPRTGISRDDPDGEKKYFERTKKFLDDKEILISERMANCKTQLDFESMLDDLGYYEHMIHEAINEKDKEEKTIQE